MTPHTEPVAVLGGGKLGSSVVGLLSRAHIPVRLWTRDPATANLLAHKHANVTSCASVADACESATVVFFAVPTAAFPEVGCAFGKVARGDHVVLHAARGVLPGFVLPHAALRQQTCVRKIGALGGPLYLDDAHAGRPLVTVVGSRYDETFEAARHITQGTPVRLHTSHDIVGVEVQGAISTVSALAVGLAEGCGLGETDQGVLLTHGLLEASRIGLVFGAELATFTGLAGVGDLIPRPVTSTRRHRELGASLARLVARNAGPIDPHRIPQLEGVLTAHEALALSKKKNLDLPLVTAVCEVLDGVTAPSAALERVLRLDLDLPTAPTRVPLGNA
jgi:glycerol-3-phosphate dehydrogenase (NAD(P)+)